MQKRFGHSTLELARGDLTALAVDAIVNAANVHLQHGGGVAWAIARKGGPAIQQESDAIIAERGPLKTGEAVMTSGGRLPARHVIHTAGPIWGDQSAADSDQRLRDAIRNSLELANKHGLKSIAFPAISTGIYRFPVERAAALMLAEAAACLQGSTGLERVVFCLYDEATWRAFESAFRAL